MELLKILFTIMMYITLTYSIPIHNNCDRFSDIDCENTNNRLKLPIVMKNDDNHANQMNPNNYEYWHSREN